jgi:hypothetical protein
MRMLRPRLKQDSRLSSKRSCKHKRQQRAQGTARSNRSNNSSSSNLRLSRLNSTCLPSTHTHHSCNSSNSSIFLISIKLTLLLPLPRMAWCLHTPCFCSRILR